MMKMILILLTSLVMNCSAADISSEFNWVNESWVSPKTRAEVLDAAVHLKGSYQDTFNGERMVAMPGRSAEEYNQYNNRLFKLPTFIATPLAGLFVVAFFGIGFLVMFLAFCWPIVIGVFVGRTVAKSTGNKTLGVVTGAATTYVLSKKQ